MLGLLAAGQGSPAALVGVATIGNVAGAVLNFALGRGALHFQDKSWFPLRGATSARAQAWFARFGVWSLLLSWVPVIGDPLTVIAGVLRVNFWVFLGLVSLGKALRYLLIAGVWQSTLG
jgi:membrane protein YqaA with SNARE-associated domain